MRLFLPVLLLICALSLSAQETSRIKVYRTTEVDDKPQLKEGMYRLSKFVADHFQFPDSLSNKEVKIFTSFVIEPDGSMTDVRAFYISVKDKMPDEVPMDDAGKTLQQKKYLQLQAEAARVISLFSERWIPAKVAGTPVRCLFNYPVNLNLE